MVHKTTSSKREGKGKDAIPNYCLLSTLQYFFLSVTIFSTYFFLEQFIVHHIIFNETKSTVDVQGAVLFG